MCTLKFILPLLKLITLIEAELGSVHTKPQKNQPSSNAYIRRMMYFVELNQKLCSIIKYVKRNYTLCGPHLCNFIPIACLCDDT